MRLNLSIFNYSNYIGINPRAKFQSQPYAPIVAYAQSASKG